VAVNQNIQVPNKDRSKLYKTTQIFTQKKGKAFPVFKHHRRCMIWILHPFREIFPGYPPNRSLDRPQSQFGHNNEQKDSHLS
jgi:hypothetical protein